MNVQQPHGEPIVFSPEEYGSPTTISPIKESKEPINPEPEKKGVEKSWFKKSWLENKRVALIIGVIGFIIIAIVFGFLFSTLDWGLIISGGNVTNP